MSENFGGFLPEDRPGRGSGFFGRYGSSDPLATSPVTPIPARRERPPKDWGAIGVEGEALVCTLSGWRMIWAMRRRISLPLSSVVDVRHDPDARANVKAKLRPRVGRTGVFRVGTYHSMQGWSFWSVGLARNAVVIEASGGRYRYVVIEVKDPVSVVRTVKAAAGLDEASSPLSGDDPSGKARP